MKHSRLLLTSLILILISVSLLPANAKFDVHVIYFKPTDAVDIDKAYHDTILKDIQKYLQSEMTRHGFDGKTFPLELDDSGEVIIHVVNGNHDSNHYTPPIGCNNPQCQSDVFDNKISPEIPFRFNNTQNVSSRDNVNLFIVGGVEMNNNWRSGISFGFTWHGGRWGGDAVVTMDMINDFPNHYLGVVAHELGHAFALDPGHNNIPESFNGTIIAWGRTTAEWGDRMRILKEEAVLLDSRPIFRKINLQEELPTPTKNEDLVDLGEDKTDMDKGVPIFVNPRKKLTMTWGELKRGR